MKKTSLLIAMLAIAITGTAQKTNSEESKNELGINLTPAFRLLFDKGILGSNRFSISYKRHLNERSALRLSVTAELMENNGHRYSGYSTTNNTMSTLNDTLFNRKWELQHTYIRPQLNIGYEWKFGERKIKWFYGADLYGGFYSIKNSILNSTASTTALVSGQLDFTAPEQVGTKRTTTYFVGVSPFFGAIYSFSKHLAVSTQITLYAAYNYSNISETNVSSTSKKSEFSTFDFTTPDWFINDVSLVYKF